MVDRPSKRIIAIGKKSIGYILFLVCAIAIYREVTQYQNVAQHGRALVEQFLLIKWSSWLLLFGLMLLNLMIEALKWKIVLVDDLSISFPKALRTIFVGQSFAFYTPNRLGDYVGRTILLEEGDKKLAIAKMAWLSYAQLIITIVMGAIALFMRPYFAAWLSWMMPLLVLLVLILYYVPLSFTGKWQFLNRFQIPNKTKSILLLLSACRYFIFILQYLWGANMLQLPIPTIELVVGIAILFVSLSVLPSISYTEWVVRGQMIVMLFSSWCNNSLLLIALATLIWGVNLVVPAIIGAFLLLGFKLKR